MSGNEVVKLSDVRLALSPELIADADGYRELMGAFYERAMFSITHTADEVQLRNLALDGFAIRKLDSRWYEMNPAVLCETRCHEDLDGDLGDWWDPIGWREVIRWAS